MTVTNIALVGVGFDVVALLLLFVIINAVGSGRLSFGPLGSLTIAERPLIYRVAVVAFLTILIGVFMVVWVDTVEFLRPILAPDL